MASINFTYFYPAVITTLALLIAKYVIKSVSNRLYYSRLMKLNNCKPPPKYPHVDPLFGLDFAKSMEKGMKEGNAMKRALLNFEAYGRTYETSIMGQKGLQTMEFENLQTVTTAKFEKFAKESSGETKAALFTAFMGKGILVSSGPIWSHARKTLRPVFYRSHFEDFVAFENHLSMLIRQIPRDGSTVDLQPLLREMFDNLSIEYLFGRSAEPLESLDDVEILEGRKFTQSFDKVLGEAAKRSRRGPYITPFYDFFGAGKRFESSVHELYSHVYKRIDAALLKKSSEPSFVFLDELIKENQDRNFIRDQLLNVFFPARDSSAIGASCILFLLARHPKVWEKLRAEVKDVEEPLTHDILKSLRYVHQVINEGIRLLSPGNFTRRLCIEDCTLPRGGGPDGSSPIFVPKDTVITMNFGVMHRDKTFWGENADEFYPERWDNINPRINPPAYMPFLIGPRTCPAQHMLLIQYAYLLVRLAKEFERIDNRDDVLEFVEEHRFAKSSRNGVKVALVPVDTGIESRKDS